MLPYRSEKGHSCAFVNFTTYKCAEAAAEALNRKHTFEGAEAPIIVRFKDPLGPRGEEGTPWRPALFVGGLPEECTDGQLRAVFDHLGVQVLEAQCLPTRSRSGQRCGCVRFSELADAEEALVKLHGKHVMKEGEEPLVVRFKDDRNGGRGGQADAETPQAHGGGGAGGPIRHARAGAARYNPQLGRRGGADPGAITKRIESAHTIAELVDVFQESCWQMNHHNLSSLWRQLGTLEGGHQIEPLVMEHLLKFTSEKIGPCDAKSLAGIVHTVAHVGAAGQTANTLYYAIAQAALGKMEDFRPQHLVDMVWAFATAGIGGAYHELFKAVSEAVLRQLNLFTPQNFANTVWAFAACGHSAPRMFAAVLQRSCRKLGEFSAHEAATTLWAYAEARVRAPALFDAVKEAAISGAMVFTQHELMTAAEAFRTADIAFETDAIKTREMIEKQNQIEATGEGVAGEAMEMGNDAPANAESAPPPAEDAAPAVASSECT